MAQLSLPRRMAVFAILVLMALWLLVVGISIRVTGATNQDVSLPSPERVASIVYAVESVPQDARSKILSALNTGNFSATIVSPEETLVENSDLENLKEEAAKYEVLLPNRELTIKVKRPLRRLGQYFAAFSRYDTFEIKALLNNKDRLILVSQGSYAVNPVGMPWGFGAGIIAVFLGLGALFFFHREIQPLTRIANLLDRVEPGGEVIELPDIKAQSPELQALVGAFRRLQGRLNTLLKSRMALIGGIQHDLRTFTTRLRLRVDKMEDETERALAIQDIEDIVVLLEDALLATRAGANELEEELIDITPLVRAEISNRREEGNADVDLVAHPKAETASVLGDRLALKRMTANLVDNALKYGNAAHVQLNIANSNVELQIDDNGPGIPEQQRALLFEPFTRLETSRARKTGGSGLGLAIVGNIVQAHGGSVKIEDAPGGGARFIVRLPVFSAAG